MFLVVLCIKYDNFKAFYHKLNCVLLGTALNVTTMILSQNTFLIWGVEIAARPRYTILQKEHL